MKKSGGVRWALLGIFLAAAPGWASEGVSIQAGLSQTSSQGNTGAVFLEALQDAGRVGGTAWSWDVAGLVGRLDGRSRVNYRDDVWLVAVGARLNTPSDRAFSGWFVEGLMGGAVGRTPAISGPLQFITAAGYEGNRWGGLVRHVSNAGLNGPNRGETMLLVSYRFR